MKEEDVIKEMLERDVGGLTLNEMLVRDDGGLSMVSIARVGHINLCYRGNVNPPGHVFKVEQEQTWS